jgi:hypothetical protein
LIETRSFIELNQSFKLKPLAISRAYRRLRLGGFDAGAFGGDHTVGDMAHGGPGNELRLSASR